MPIILDEILNVPLQDIFTMKCLQSCYGNGVELLKRIIYLASRYLSQRSSTEIKTACSDLLYLYQLYFHLQANDIRKEIMQQAHNTTLLPYLDLKQYIEDRVQELKLTYLSIGDVLHVFRYERNMPILTQIEGMRSDFSNLEFFAVLALYHASVAISHVLEKPQISVNNEKIHDAILEAQLSIDYARQLSTIDSPEFSPIIQDCIKGSRREIAQKAHEVRYGDKHQRRRAKAIEYYAQGKYRNRFDAALHLIEPIQAYSAELNIPPLKFDSAQDTIYKWLSHYDKTKS